MIHAIREVIKLILVMYFAEITAGKLMGKKGHWNKLCNGFSMHFSRWTVMSGHKLI